MAKHDGRAFLGSEKFILQCEKFLNKSTDLSEIPAYQKRAARPSLKKLFREINEKKDREKRNYLIRKAYLEHGYYMKEIADFLGIHYATVSRAVNTNDKERGTLLKHPVPF